jgi:MFS family permease
VISWTRAVEANNDATLQRNFIVNVVDGALFAFALSLVSQQTVLPVFVKNIGGGNVAVGMIPVLWTFGFNFPQILIANYTQKAPRKKELLLKTAMGQRIPWLLLAIASFLLMDKVSTDIALLLFFLLFTLSAVGGSINLPVWFDLIAKIIPVQLRGRLFAARSIAGAALGLLGGGAVTYILNICAYPTSFALLFLLAFCFMMLSYMFLTALQETGGSAQHENANDGKHLPALPHILRTQPNFRNFLVADALLISSTMANAFFTVHAFQKFSLSDSYAGTFTIAMMASMMGGSVLFGYLADHFGHKINLIISGVSTALACLIALAAPSVEIYMMVFACAAFTVAVAVISRLPIIAELCTDAERPTYIALANLVTSPFVLFGVAGGWVADRLGYDAVFIVAGVLATAASLWLLFMVEEPRKMFA